MSKEISIKEFDLKSMFRPDPSKSYGVKVAIIGKPGTGKSELMKDITRTFASDIPVGVVFNGSEENNHFYSQFFPELNIYNEYNEDVMKIFEERQKKVMETNDDPTALLIIDDCSDDPKFFRRPQFQRHFKNSRHWQTLTLLGLQYCNDIPPTIKTNVDYSFIFREPNDSNRKKIYDNYAGIVGNYTDFCDLMDQLTEDYTALVINNRVQTNDPSVCVCYYKANLHGSFEFGCEEYKQWSSTRFNPNYRREN